MKNRVSDKDVLQLFTSMKNAENNYPQDMIESRRDMFAKQAAAMAVLAKAGGDAVASTATTQTAATASSGAAGTGSSISMATILETALVIAIIAEAGVAAYVYREKIAEFFNSTFGPKAEQVASPPEGTSSDPVITDEVTIIAIPSDGSPTVTITETPIPPELVNPGTTDNDNGGNTRVASTQAPTDDNPGLHLGQTKQPTNEPKKNDNKK